MKFLPGLAFVASVATSSVHALSSPPEAAPAYLLRSSSSLSAPETSIPYISRQIVRQIMLRRIGADDAIDFFTSVPEDDNNEDAATLLRRFGVQPPLLLDNDPSVTMDHRRPHNLVLVLEGVQPKHAKALEDALAGERPAWNVRDPPSHAANERFFVNELRAMADDYSLPPVVRDDLVKAFGPDFPATWENGLFVGFFDLKATPATIDVFLSHLPRLLALVDSGDVEALVLCLPEASRFSKIDTWSDTVWPETTYGSPVVNELHRRMAVDEAVLVEDDDALFASTMAEDADPALTAAASELPLPGPHYVPPPCFHSFNACTTQTGGCFGHGRCVDKYARNSGGADAAAAAAPPSALSDATCFVCHCFSTLNWPEDDPRGLSTTQWGGSMCQKKDVSVPFWLLTGFTVAMMGVLSFAVGLVFSIGEEKLPGVIGAGVGRK